MDRRVTVLGVVLASGLLLLTVYAAYLRYDVVALRSVETNEEKKWLDPVHLPAGRYTVWLEDHPAWPDLMSIRVTMEGLEENNQGYIVVGNIPDTMKYREVEGIRCFMVAIFNELPANLWEIIVEFNQLNIAEEDRQAILFVLSTPGPWVVAGLAIGTVAVVIGITIVEMRRRKADIGVEPR